MGKVRTRSVRALWAGLVGLSFAQAVVVACSGKGDTDGAATGDAALEGAAPPPSDAAVRDGAGDGAGEGGALSTLCQGGLLGSEPVGTARRRRCRPHGAPRRA